jgi:hypothetical protein
MSIKKIDIIFYLFLIIGITGCGSGEYDINETTVEYTEKTLKYDTLIILSSDTSLHTTQKEEQLQIKTEICSFTVQIGAFANESNFQRFYENAKRVIGNNVYYRIINSIYRIRIGEFNSKSEALKLLEKVKALGYFDAFVLTTKK